MANGVDGVHGQYAPQRVVEGNRPKKEPVITQHRPMGEKPALCNKEQEQTNQKPAAPTLVQVKFHIFAHLVYRSGNFF